MLEAHLKFEEAILPKLTQLGFIVESSEYHKKTSDEVQDVFHKHNDVTALYVRTRADRIVMHKEKPIPAFELEFKTRSSQYNADMLLEALPLAVHLWKSKLGIRCLYAYWDTYRDIHKGFWVNHRNIPKISRIVFPPKKDIPKEQLSQLFKKIFGNHIEQIFSEKSTKGSNDPYVVIEYEELAKISHWEKLIMYELRRVTQPVSINAYRNENKPVRQNSTYSIRTLQNDASDIADLFWKK